MDILLVERELVDSREQAQRLILAGKVKVNGNVISKAGSRVPEDVSIEILEYEKFVSRGGYKLESALRSFNVSVEGKVAADIGASTGGFTDCLLQYGARKVYAIDVGYGQLHWRLRQDTRVIAMERMNARHLTEESLPEKVDIVTIDVSFISLRLILPAVKKIIKPDATVICLVKPQFEAGKEKVPKGGVIKDPYVHKEVLQRFLSETAQLGFRTEAIIPSPIPGAEGNREYLALLKPMDTPASIQKDICLDEIIESAFTIN